MIACYIIYTAAFDKFYVGATQGDVLTRLEKHNTKGYDNSATAYTNDWEVYLIIVCTDYPQAINIERHIKRMKSKIYIQNLKKYPEMIDKLLSQHRSH
ncbi:MAG: GIY-YIG nuclease family protein [Gloeobacteraceae cyanobacterium ES-bin-316]|nr:GIY-YIG nuclease family protein [Ferruginibacter sp.]